MGDSRCRGDEHRLPDPADHAAHFARSEAAFVQLIALTWQGRSENNGGDCDHAGTGGKATHTASGV
jgi:hypothetical protein